MAGKKKVFFYIDEIVRFYFILYHVSLPASISDSEFELLFELEMLTISPTNEKVFGITVLKTIKLLLIFLLVSRHLGTIDVRLL